MFIPDPGSRDGSKRHLIPDPGSGSATLVFTISAWKVAKTTANQRLIFKVQKLVEALI
jgi:hypothetical protein